MPRKQDVSPGASSHGAACGSRRPCLRAPAPAPPSAAPPGPRSQDVVGLDVGVQHAAVAQVVEGLVRVTRAHARLMAWLFGHSELFG